MIVQVESVAVEATVPALSLTDPENVYVPAFVGVPLRVPVAGASPIPGGSEPTEIEKVYGETPPVAVNPTGTIGTPTVAAEKTGAVIDSGVGAGFTVNTSGTPAGVTATLPTLSVAATVNVDEPEAVGVPEMIPVAGPIDRPGGRLPVAIR